VADGKVECLLPLPTLADVHVVRAALRRYHATEAENAAVHVAEAWRATMLATQLDRLSPPAEG
jgi:hypothetical protein